MLDEPADRHQASLRPPPSNHVQVNIGAVADDDVFKVLLVSEPQDGEVVEPIVLASLGPVDHAIVSVAWCDLTGP